MLKKSRTILAIALYLLLHPHILTAQCDFTEDFSPIHSWTQVGSDVYITNGEVLFDNVADGNGSISHRIHAPLGDTLDACDTWIADFDWNTTEVGSWGGGQGPAVGHVLLALTAGTGENYVSNQDGILVRLMTNHPQINPPVGPIGFELSLRNGTTNQVLLPRILMPAFNTTYYCRMERNSPTQATLSVFTDPARTQHVPGSPQTYIIPATVAGFNTIQSGNVQGGDPNRVLSGTLDNVCINTQPTAPLTPVFTSSTNNLVANFATSLTGITSYNWTFGDGTTGTGPNPVHTYGVPGNYEVCLTVTNALGCTGTTCDSVEVVSQPILNCDFTEDFSPIHSWTQVGSDVYITNGEVLFDNVADGNGSISHRIHAPLDDTLDACDTWIADFDWNTTEVGSWSGGQDPAVGHVLLALTAGTGENYVSNQDGILVRLMTNHPQINPPVGPIGFELSLRNGTTNQVLLPRILMPAFNTIYYCRMERNSPTQATLSVFTDPARTQHVPGSPQTYIIPATVAGFNTIQSGNVQSGDPNRVLSGTLDNVCINVQPGNGLTPYFTHTSNVLTALFSTNLSGVANYDWEFGDGTVGSGPNPSHTYPMIGTYQVCLTTTDSSGCKATFCDTMSVSRETSINTYEHGIKLWPNPANDLLTIDMGVHVRGTFVLWDITGREILNESLVANINQLDVSRLPSGVYAATVKLDNFKDHFVTMIRIE